MCQVEIVVTINSNLLLSNSAKLLQTCRSKKFIQFFAFNDFKILFYEKLKLWLQLRHLLDRNVKTAVGSAERAR